MAENVKNVDATIENTTEQTAQEILNKIQAGNAELQELDDDSRDVLIHDFNEKNKGIAELVNEKPTQEFIDQTKKDFEEYQAEYTTLSYFVADKTHALEYAKWLKGWNTDYAVAPANYWIGVIKFDEVITQLIETIEKNPEEELTFDYGALTYVYNLMMSPVGTGLAYANWMADNQETYNAILNKLGEHIDTIELIKKKIGLLQSRWAMACQGFKMNLLIENLEDLKNIDINNM